MKRTLILLTLLITGCEYSSLGIKCIDGKVYRDISNDMNVVWVLSEEHKDVTCKEIK